MVALGEVLAKSEDWIQLDPQREYQEVTVRNRGQGAVLRRVVTGTEIAGSRRLRVHSEQFIVSRIDARHGSTGVIPDDLEGAIVTNDFPVFDCGEKSLLPGYLGWYSKTTRFVDACRHASEGSTNRVRLKEAAFLDIEMPLPPIEEQRRVVERLSRLTLHFAYLEGGHERTRSELRALLASVQGIALHSCGASVNVAMGDVIRDLENGWSPACLPYPAADGEWGVIKLGAVSFGRYDSSENKQLPDGLTPRPRYEIGPGDVLISRANTRELVGACVEVESTPPQLMLCDKVFRVQFHPDTRILPAYLNFILKTPDLRTQIEAAASGTSPTMQNISKPSLMALVVPLPSMDGQRLAVERMNWADSHGSAVRARLDAIERERLILHRAVLHRAFASA